jgi:multiple sugar transport system permease protein
MNAAGTLRKRRVTPLTLVNYGLLSIGGVIMLFPYLWMISTSFKQRGTTYNLSLIPEAFSTAAYQALLSASYLPRWYLNSIIIGVISTASVVFFSAMAGYVFAKYRFPGREIMFTAILATIMIPTEMMIVPWYVGIAQAGWVDKLVGVLVPNMLSAFGVFVMRQFIANIPDELLDAARLDGVSEFGLFWRICLPLARPALAVVAIFTFLGNWNDFLWPLIVVNSTSNMTLQVGLSQLTAQEVGKDWSGTMAGSALASIPMLVVFLFFQRQIVRGMKISGMKG